MKFKRNDTEEINTTGLQKFCLVFNPGQNSEFFYPFLLRVEARAIMSVIKQ